MDNQKHVWFFKKEDPSNEISDQTTLLNKAFWMGKRKINHDLQKKNLDIL